MQNRSRNLSNVRLNCLYLCSWAQTEWLQLLVQTDEKQNCDNWRWQNSKCLLPCGVPQKKESCHIRRQMARDWRTFPGLSSCVCVREWASVKIIECFPDWSILQHFRPSVLTTSSDLHKWIPDIYCVLTSLCGVVDAVTPLSCMHDYSPFPCVRKVLQN